MITVWDSASKSASCVLSDDDHVVTSVGNSAQGVLATTFKTIADGGKFYLELDGHWGGGTNTLGFCDSGYPGVGTGPPINDNLLLVTNNGYTAWFGPQDTFAAIDVARTDLAVDLDAAFPVFYMRHNNGAWLKSGNPEAGTGGFVAGRVPTVYIRPMLYFSSDAVVVGLNAGDRPFAGVVPAGFEAWDGAGAGGGAGVAANIQRARRRGRGR